MAIVLREVSSETADAILAGTRPESVLVHRLEDDLDRPESARVVEKAGFAMASETDDTDEAGNALRVKEWELAVGP